MSSQGAFDQIDSCCRIPGEQDAPLAPRDRDEAAALRAGQSYLGAAAGAANQAASLVIDLCRFTLRRDAPAAHAALEIVRPAEGTEQPEALLGQDLPSRVPSARSVEAVQQRADGVPEPGIWLPTGGGAPTPVEGSARALECVEVGHEVATDDEERRVAEGKEIAGGALLEAHGEGMHGFERPREPSLAASCAPRQRGHFAPGFRQERHDVVRLAVCDAAEQERVGFDRLTRKSGCGHRRVTPELGARSA